MSALDVLTGAFRNVGLEVTTPGVTDTDFQTVQMVQFINEAGDDIARRTRWQRMLTTDTIVGPTSSHTLPTDYFALEVVYLNEATWSSVRVVVEPHDWAFLLVRDTVQNYCHIEGNALLFQPAVGANGATMRYASSRWVDGKDAVTADGDDLLIPDALVEKGAVWRWKRQHGLPYEDMLAELEADIATEIKADRGLPTT